MDSFHQTMFELSFPYHKRKDFQILNRIGSGYVGEVFSGKLKLFDETIDCVVKKVSSSNYTKSSQRMLYQDIIDEVEIGHQFMGLSEHQIEFYGYSTLKKHGQTSIYLLMERTDAIGDIETYINQNKFWKSLSEEEYNNSPSYTLLDHKNSYWDYILPLKEKITIMYQMSLAIQDIHKFNVSIVI